MLHAALSNNVCVFITNVVHQVYFVQLGPKIKGKGLDQSRTLNFYFTMGQTNILISLYIWPIPIYRYRPYRYQPLYWLLCISVISVSAKYRLKYMDICQNIGKYWPEYLLYQVFSISTGLKMNQTKRNVRNSYYCHEILKGTLPLDGKFPSMNCCWYIYQ